MFEKALKRPAKLSSWTIGDENAAFRQMNNVSLRDDKYFGALITNNLTLHGVRPHPLPIALSEELRLDL